MLRLNQGGFWRKKILAPDVTSLACESHLKAPRNTKLKGASMFQRMSWMQKSYVILYHTSTSPFMQKKNSLHTHSPSVTLWCEMFWDLYHLFKKPAFCVDSLRLHFSPLSLCRFQMFFRGITNHWSLMICYLTWTTNFTNDITSLKCMDLCTWVCSSFPANATCWTAQALSSHASYWYLSSWGLQWC